MQVSQFLQTPPIQFPRQKPLLRRSCLPKEPFFLCEKNTPLQASKSQTEAWESMIKVQFTKHRYQNCILLYNQMLEEEATPNPSTIRYVLRSCSAISDLRSLRLIHNDILRLRLGLDDDLAATLLNGYFNCGVPDTAWKLFESMPQRGIRLFTVAICHACKSRQLEKSIACFRNMLEEGVSPDGVSLASFLSMLAQYGNIKQGKEVHCYLIRNRFVQNSVLISSLVNFYAKLQRIDYAERTLVQSTKANVVAWTAMIGGLVRINDLHGALLLYKHMVCSGKKPTEKSLSIILKAIRGLRFLRFGSQIHGYVIKVRFQLDKFIQSGLIGMYAACGAPSHLCRRLFDQMFVKDLVAWTTMIVAHGLQGEGSATLRLFDEMQERGVCPDSATFASALSACSSSGLLYEGLKLFCSMIHKHGIKPTKEHYASLSCLIAKDRRIGEAYKEYERLGLNEDVGALESLLRACKVHGEIAYGEMARRRLLEIEPGNYSACRILADMYFAAGRWEDARSLLRDSGNARVS